MKHSSLYRGNSMRQQFRYFFLFSTQIFRSLTNTVDIFPLFFSTLLHYHTFFGSDFIVDLKRLENKLSSSSPFFPFFIFYRIFSHPLRSASPIVLAQFETEKCRLLKRAPGTSSSFHDAKMRFFPTLSIHPSPIPSSHFHIAIPLSISMVLHNFNASFFSSMMFLMEVLLFMIMIILRIMHSNSGIIIKIIRK